MKNNKSFYLIIATVFCVLCISASVVLTVIAADKDGTVSIPTGVTNYNAIGITWSITSDSDTIAGSTEFFTCTPSVQDGKLKLDCKLYAVYKNSCNNTKSNNVTITVAKNAAIASDVRVSYSVDGAAATIWKSTDSSSFKIEKTNQGDASQNAKSVDFTVLLEISTFTNKASFAAPNEKGCSATLEMSNGSSLVIGESFNNKTQYNISSIKTTAVSAKNGYVFEGWCAKDPETGIVKMIGGATIGENVELPAGVWEIIPVFTPSDAVKKFQVIGGSTYYYLDLALSAAAANGGTVTLTDHATAVFVGGSTGVVPAGVTLLIPFDSYNTTYTSKPGVVTDVTKWVCPTEYRSLTLPSGLSLSVYGNISLPAKCSPGRMGSDADIYRQAGSTTGSCGFLKMNSDSLITLQSGGKLYAYGYVTGSGSITALAGSEVYENFQFADWRGGKQISELNSDGHGVSPMSEYYIQNVEVPLKFEAGARGYGFTAVQVKPLFSWTSVESERIPIIGGPDDEALFNIIDGYIIKDYLESRDRMHIDIQGNASLGSIQLNLAAGTSSYPIDTADYVLALGSNLRITIGEGKSVSFSTDFAFLPGFEMEIANNASFTSDTGTLYLYDSAQWGYFVGGFSYNGGSYGQTPIQRKPFKIYPVAYAPGRTYTRKESDLVDAEVLVNGTLKAKNIFTTTYNPNLLESGANPSDGANIYSTGNGKIVFGSFAKTGQVRQAIQDVCECTLIYTNNGITYSFDTSLAEGKQKTMQFFWIPTTSAKLKNKDGSFVATASYEGFLEYTYDSVNGVWHTKKIDAEIEPTCSETGLTEGSHCPICNYVFEEQQVVEKLPHTEVIDKAVDATCTETGLTEGKHCSVCGTVIVAQEEIPATGHTPGAAATCTTAQTCTVCGTVLSAAKGHTPGAAATCTTAQTCTVCGDTLNAALGHNYSAVVTDPTCTKDGYTTYTCSVCGDSYEEPIEASGHKYNAVVTDPTCTEDGYTTYTCTACGDSYTGNVIAATGHSYGEWEVNDGIKTSTCSGCSEIETRLVGAMNDLYSVQDVLFYNGTFAHSNVIGAGEIVFKDPNGNELESILGVPDSNGVLFLSYEMPSNTIMNVVEFVIWIDGVRTDVFTIDFDSYAKTQEGTDYETVAQAIVEYGKASSTYFGETEIDQVTAVYTQAPAAGKSIFADATSQYLDTYGASFVFDEYIAIKVYMSGNFEFKQGCTYQVGVLFGDATANELTVGSVGTACKAYVLYNTLADVEISASDWVGLTSATAADISTPPVLANRPGIQINLKSVEYSKCFAIRAYLIERDAQGEETVYYGKQVNYGLADYVLAMCARDEQTLQNSYKVGNPKAFKQFLIETWNYAVAAKETNWKK